DSIGKMGLIPDIKNSKFWFSDNVNKSYDFYLKNKKDVSVHSLKALTETEQDQIESLIKEFPDVLTDKVGRVAVVKHKIIMTAEAPFKSKPYKASPKVEEELNKQIQFMLENDIIRPSKSEYSSPVFLRPKPNGEW